MCERSKNITLLAATKTILNLNLDEKNLNNFNAIILNILQ